MDCHFPPRRRDGPIFLVDQGGATGIFGGGPASGTISSAMPGKKSDFGIKSGQFVPLGEAGKLIDLSFAPINTKI